MDEVSLGVPQPLLDALPEDGHDAGLDMQRAVEGIERTINRGVRDAADDGAAVSHVLDVIDHLESRYEEYDDLVPELRAWGQSPVYAIAWRNLQADVVAQLYDHDDLAARLDRERNARMVEDGIRLGDAIDQ